MPAAKYIVELTADEHEQLVGIVGRGKTLARRMTRARILLKADLLRIRLYTHEKRQRNS